MLASPISILPNEMLCQVFDYLSVEQQLSTMLTCVRWCQILSGDRYMRQRRMVLCSSNLCKANGKSIKQMKRYRAFRVKDCIVADKDQFLKSIRAFLSCKDIANSIEELTLDLYWFSLADLFSGEKDGLYLPQLKTISYHHRSYMRNMTRYHLRAPKLTSIFIEDTIKTDNTLMEQFRGQIEHLRVENISQIRFAEIFGASPFTHLKQLTLAAGFGGMFRARDFTAAQLRMFGRLNYLEILDVSNLLNLAYRSIFSASRNLETLIVDGSYMTEDAFLEIRNLPKLKELSLMVCIELSNATRKISLPQLQKLSVFFGSLPTLAGAPRLKSLTIRNPAHFGERNSRRVKVTLTEFLKLFLRHGHLESLELDEVDMNSSVVSQLCKITGLKKLVLRGIEIDQHCVRRMLNAPKQLQQFQISGCDLESGDCLKHRNDSDFFQNLRQQFARCRIVEWDNRIIQNCPSTSPVMTCFKLTMDTVIFFWFLAIVFMVYLHSIARKVVNAIVR